MMLSLVIALNKPGLFAPPADGEEGVGNSAGETALLLYRCPVVAADLGFAVTSVDEIDVEWGRPGMRSPSSMDELCKEFGVGDEPGLGPLGSAGGLARPASASNRTCWAGVMEGELASGSPSWLRKGGTGEAASGDGERRGVCCVEPLVWAMRTAPKRLVRLPNEFGLRACGLTGGDEGEWEPPEGNSTVAPSSLVGLTLGAGELALWKP